MPPQPADHTFFTVEMQFRFRCCRTPNHRRFLRSRYAERQGKSLRELMTGQGHPHWLTLLGLGLLQPRRA